MRTTTLALCTTALILTLAGCCSTRNCCRPQHAGPALPPPPPREFRAAWVATVGNIDWPSKRGLSTQQQIAEIRAIVDRAADLHLNALILQVRTSCDAFYASPYEPWSEYLTGRQGVAPDPYYDPLATWVAEAHRRGIELHAWFNPYRARSNAAKSPDAPDHISKTRPDIVKTFNGWEWLDPGEPDARRQTLNVITDVVRRYAIDGVHLDDYFYPYPEYLTDKTTKQVADFPDDPSWKRYQDAGGKLERADWRRDNVNRMIHDIYAGIKSVRPSVKFGISPFGIWRPGNPEMVKGFDQYEKLYADAKLWLNEGWCDYWTPQIYWRLSSEGQPYAELLKWWVGENKQGRHIWPGNYISAVNDTAKSWPPEEVVDQIRTTRDTPGASGNVLFSMVALMQNRKGMSDLLRDGPYREPALVPASPWLDARPISAPLTAATVNRDGSVQVSWENEDTEEPALWSVWARYGNEWRFSTYPSSIHSVRIVPAPGKSVTSVGVGSVDRAGNANFAKPLWLRGRKKE
jgi:uncharacterized lipoprotein YddW (UPF0748 family)